MGRTSERLDPGCVETESRLRQVTLDTTEGATTRHGRCVELFQGGAAPLVRIVSKHEGDVEATREQTPDESAADQSGAPRHEGFFVGRHLR